MPTFNTADLDGIPLAYAVAMAEGRAQKRFLLDGVTTVAPYQFKRTPDGPNVALSEALVLIDLDRGGSIWHPHIAHGLGGPILERERISVHAIHGGNGWSAQKYVDPHGAVPVYGYGRTMLIAGMTCYVASKLGATVEIPEVLS